jgi:mannose-6-phosphate isomerase-like protein (cupin superfamily)
MPGFIGDFERLATANEDFRQVLFTAPHSQLVAMTLQPGDEIGREVHTEDQLFFFVSGGPAGVTLGDESHLLGSHSVVVVAAGTEHNVRNEGSQPLRLLTVYAPAHHPDRTVHRTRADADAAEAAEQH